MYALHTEYRLCRSAFQMILSSLTWCISGVWSILSAIFVINTCLITCSFQLLSYKFIKLLIVKFWTKEAPGISLLINSPLCNQGSFRIEINAPKPLLSCCVLVIFVKMGHERRSLILMNLSGLMKLLCWVRVIRISVLNQKFRVKIGFWAKSRFNHFWEMCYFRWI